MPVVLETEMFFATLTEVGATPALEKTLSFNQARLRMIAENVANIHTPGYRAKQLDVRAFQGALRKAMDARGSDPSKPFVVNAGSEVKTDRFGRLHVTPSIEPVENVLFHDGTNLSIERQMADLAETGMMNQLTSRLLRGRYAGLRAAIRGTVG
ncbi:MAG: hypothetical protein IH989_07815 [Planctomycetes bacterium]|nr:hypothetical protein [Planctomycetota bacterium]